MAISGFADSAFDEGLAAFHDGRYTVALGLFKESSKDKSNTKARAFVALTEAALNDCLAALPTLTDSAYSTDPDLAKLTGIAAAKCYGSSGDAGKAFTLLERLETQFPGDADVLYTSAKLHMRAFNDATLAMFQKVPSSYRVHELSAEIFEVNNRYGEAVAEYRKAIAENPQAPEIHFRLGRAILMQAHTPEALEQGAAEFAQELKLSPEDAASEFQLGQIAQVQGKPAEAVEHLTKALALSPNFIEALIGLAKIRLQEKKNPEAISLLEKAVQLQPTNERAHYVLLTAYRNSGQMDKARQEKETLDKLQKPPDGEFSDFLKRIGEKPPAQ